MKQAVTTVFLIGFALVAFFSFRRKFKRSAITAGITLVLSYVVYVVCGLIGIE